jgi:putative membrane protein
VKLSSSLLFFLVILPIFVLGITIGFFNDDPVVFDYLLGRVEMPLIALLIAEFVLAVGLTLLATFVRVFGLKSEIRRLRKQLRDSEIELKNLRVLAAPPVAAPVAAAPRPLPPPPVPTP